MLLAAAVYCLHDPMVSCGAEETWVLLNVRDMTTVWHGDTSDFTVLFLHGISYELGKSQYRHRCEGFEFAS